MRVLDLFTVFVHWNADAGSHFVNHVYKMADIGEPYMIISWLPRVCELQSLFKIVEK